MATAVAVCLLLGWTPAPPAAAGPGGASSALSAGTPAAPSSAYWMAGADGSVYAFKAPALGSMAGTRLARPVVGIAATSTGRGYWLVAADGAVFTFGDARFFGSLGSVRLNRPIVGMVPTAGGRGYWLVADDGGVFAFGDAPFLGSTGGIRLNRPVKAIAATPSGAGYWLVADDGGVFAFGDAAFFGSTGALRLNRPIVAAASSPSGRGYWLVADDGGVFAFGDGRFFGSTGGLRLNRPVVGVAPSLATSVYPPAVGDGGVFPFGDARFAGSAGGTALAAPMVGIAVDPSPQLFVPGQRGYDISWPQCGRAYPPKPFDISVVGVNGGRPFTNNPCFVDQATRWASPDRLDVYINLNRPPDTYTGGCPPGDLPCVARTFGREAARWSVARVRANGLAPRLWWLDIEGPSTWYSQTNLNALIIQAAADALEAEGLTVGLYGTRYQWGVITGGYTTRSPLPLWAAGTIPLQRCNEPWGGGYVVLSQVLGTHTPSGFDENHAC